MTCMPSIEKSAATPIETQNLCLFLPSARLTNLYFSTHLSCDPKESDLEVVLKIRELLQ